MNINLIASRWTDEESGISIEATAIGKGTALLFDSRKNGMTLNKQGGWEYEPSPSARDENYLNRCRWDDFCQAAKAVGEAPSMDK